MRFNEKRYAEEYNRRLIDEGYPGRLLGAVIKELDGIKSVIDIGAGTGFFSVPLAESGLKVHAVEPSSEMIRILKAKLTDKSRNNITLYQQNWESWESALMECSMCIHSIYPMSDPSKAILNMIQYSSRRILAVKKPGSPTLTKIVKDHFNIKNDDIDYIRLIESILEDKKIKYLVKEFSQERKTCFTDISEKAEYYCYFLKLDKSHTSSIFKILSDVSSFEKNHFCYTSTYNDYIYVF